MNAAIKRKLDKVLALIWSKKRYKFFIRDWISLGDLEACADVVGTMRFSRNMEPLLMNAPKEKSILCISPHPDDEILGACGTIIKAIDAGADVLTLYLTSGKPYLAEEMETEAGMVSSHLGYTPRFLRFPHNNIPMNRADAEKLAACIKDFQPDACFIPFLLDDHDDHRRANQLLNLAYSESMLPNNFMVWAYQVYTAIIPNIIVDITDLKDKKAEAIKMWATQSKWRDWSHFTLGLNAFNSRFLRIPGKNYVESFFVLPLDEYMKLCSIYFKSDSSSNYYHPNYQS